MVQSHLIPIYFNFSVSNLNHIISIKRLEEIICLKSFIYVYIASNFREIIELLEYELTLDSDCLQTCSKTYYIWKKWTVITYFISKLFPIFFQDLVIDFWQVIFLKICLIDISNMFMT